MTVPQRRSPQRRGVALVAVLAVMALLAVLAAGSLASTAHLADGSRLADADSRLLAEVDHALGAAALDWRSKGIDSLAIGGTVRFHPARPPQLPGVATVTVTRLDAMRFWVVGEVERENGIRRRSHRLMELPPLPLDAIGAITSTGSVTIWPQASVAGHVPREGCLSAAGISAGIAVPPGVSATAVDGALIPDSIPVVREPLVTVYQQLESWLPAAVAANPTASVPGGSTIVVSGGDQRILAAGDLNLAGGTGNGVIIAQGRLRITGNIDFAGLLIGRAGVSFESGTTTIEGAVLAGTAADSAGLAKVTLGSAVAIRGSPCRVAEAVARLRLPRPVAGRSWVDLY